MIVVNTDFIPGKKIVKSLGLVKGNTIRARIKEVSQRTFTDERGRPWRFTWRTIESWWSRYRKHGRTVPQARSRSDKGRTRKVELEAVAQAGCPRAVRIPLSAHGVAQGVPVPCPAL